jgi:RNA polymerase sigma-70 factor (ECF subfamily)
VSRGLRAQSETEVEQVFREHHARLLAWLIYSLGDFDAAEEALQEAFLIALSRWPEAGMPENPRAWLAVTARNCAIDRLRRERRRPELEEQMNRLMASPADPDAMDDRQLRLVFTCCHPALSLEARVALTLRAICGLSVSEIASAFLISEATLAKRLGRAKHKIRTAGIPYEVPAAESLGERLAGVLSVIYLVFNEGYLATDGPALIRRDLCEEAIRLARLLTTLMPSEPEVRALLALLLLTDARREARIDPNGDPVLLPDQDRSRWDRGQIQEGLAELARAARHSPAGRYQLQAAIAAEHSSRARAADTDWERIVELYDALLASDQSQVARLNRLVAVSMAQGPQAAYAELEHLGDSLDDYSYFHSTRADLLSRLGRLDEAAAAFERALALTTNPKRRESLARAVASVGAGERTGPDDRRL